MFTLNDFIEPAIHFMLRRLVDNGDDDVYQAELCLVFNLNVSAIGVFWQDVIALTALQEVDVVENVSFVVNTLGRSGNSCLKLRADPTDELGCLVFQKVDIVVYVSIDVDRERRAQVDWQVFHEVRQQLFVFDVIELNVLLDF